MDEQYWPLVQAFLEIGISILAPLFFGFLAYLAKQGMDMFKVYIEQQKLESEYDLIVGLINQFVLAAEQNGLTGQLSDIGKEKKEWVIDQVQRELTESGIHIDVTTLSNLIEAAVYEAFVE